MGLPKVIIMRLHEECRLAHLLYRLNKLQQALDQIDPNHPRFSILQVGIDHIKSEAHASADRIKKLLLRETLTSVENKPNATGKDKRIPRRIK